MSTLYMEVEGTIARTGREGRTSLPIEQQQSLPLKERSGLHTPTMIM